MSRNITLRTAHKWHGYKLGDHVHLFARDWRVISIDIAGTRLELRPLRWHERLWLRIARCWR